MKKIIKRAPVRLAVTILSLAVIALHLILRNNHKLMSLLSERIVKPIREYLTLISSHFSFSVAEICIGFAVIALLVYITIKMLKLFKYGIRFQDVYSFFITIAAAVFFIYAGFTFLWGTYYYGDDFQAKSGLRSDPVSTKQLETATAYFADLANIYSSKVPRDENGICSFDRSEVLAASSDVYRKTEKRIACLDGPDVRVKGIKVSKAMSLIDFTGFFFPFTGEANVNMDFPSSMLPSTTAHELAHLRGVAKEQDANFCAVMASLDYGRADYVYSASLLAYTHLANALRSADYHSWEKISSGLDEKVMADFRANKEYWNKYETPVRKISNTVYEDFLFSYDQNLGLKSYGACVDLLVNYYQDYAAVNA